MMEKPVGRSARLQEIFDHLAKAPVDDDESIEGVRKFAEIYGMGCRGTGLERSDISSLTVGSRPAEWVVPPNGKASNARVLYIHGGGWFSGSLSSHRAIAAELAWRSGQPVLAIDYRLAPENPYPAGLDDCFAAFKFARAHKLNGFSSGPVAIVGDSAGANLAAAVTIRCIEQNERGPVALGLISPLLDTVLPKSSIFSSPVDDPVVSVESLAPAITYYADGEALAEPTISPLRASADVLAQFPPTLIQLSSVETLRDQAVLFANRMWDAASPARLSVWPDMPHVWHFFTGVLAETDAAISEMAAFAKSAGEAIRQNDLKGDPGRSA